MHTFFDHHQNETIYNDENTHTHTNIHRTHIVWPQFIKCKRYGDFYCMESICVKIKSDNITKKIYKMANNDGAKNLAIVRLSKCVFHLYVLQSEINYWLQKNSLQYAVKKCTWLVKNFAMRLDSRKKNQRTCIIIGLCLQKVSIACK